ncbi:MAG: MBL fold metallo-hydrolase [Alphaproteobacteria bacterium]|nr:MBL fold metallo-hydrolase [Alphaproteobacteria bacterium]
MAKEEYGTIVELVGGNNEHRIGANSLLIEHRQKGEKTKRIMIDTGAMLPPKWVDYDAVVPDLSKYFDSPHGKAQEPVDAMFITHCHEDHIGALVYLAAAKYKLPKIYTGDYTKKFILSQMDKYNILPEYIPEIETVRHGQKIEIADDFQVYPFNVSHPTKDPLGFYVQTQIDGKFNAGYDFFGDYNLREVFFGEGFDEQEFIDFHSDKPLTGVFMDSTSVSMSEDKVVSLDKAIDNKKRKYQQHPEDQIFFPVIARSLQHLAIGLVAAKETGRTVLVASPGLRQSVSLLKAGLKNNDPELRKRFRVKEGEEFDFDELVKIARNSADIEDYLNKYDYSQRLIVISGALDEEKNGQKSRLRLMSEQNKVSYDAKGKMKGKGLSGDPQFTIDSRTTVDRSQRPISGINGPDYPVTNARLRALGAYVMENGDTEDEISQNTGHAVAQETQKMRDLLLNFSANHEDFLSGRSKLYIIGIHGDTEQIQTLSKVVQSPYVETIECKNTDKIHINQGKLEKIEGLPFADQTWVGVQKYALSGHGADDVFIFDLVDKNFMKLSHLQTVINIQTNANPHAKKENNFHLSRAIAEAEKFEEEGMSMSNIAIRNQIHGDRRGRITEDYSYSQIKALREEKSKSPHKKKFARSRKSRGGR